MVAISAVIPAAAKAQSPAASPANSNLLDAAREDFRGAARSFAAVKLPRSTEPAARFEA